MMNQEQITTKIKTKGFWRVVIRPTVFESKRIPTLSDVRKLIGSSKVSFRGWDYPFWEESQAQNIGDFVECSVDWTQYVEYFRFYRTGQFVHIFALHEDLYNPDELNRIMGTSYPPRPQRSGYLSFVGATFTVTEIFEFVARLASKGILVPSASISIGLHNMGDHQLAAFDSRRFMPDWYVRASDEPILIEKEVSEQDLITNKDELALDVVVEIFENFNWNEPPRHILAEDQKKLRERRL